MGSAYSTKAELKTATNWPFWVLAVMPPGCFLSGLRRRGLRLLKLSFTVLFRSLPLLSLFSSPFFYPLHLRQYFPPLAVVAFRLLAVSDLLGSRCRLRASVRRASGRWALALAVVVLVLVQALPFQAIVQYVQIVQFISCTFGYF